MFRVLGLGFTTQNGESHAKELENVMENGIKQWLTELMVLEA